jgi:hypothetical protein
MKGVNISLLRRPEGWIPLAMSATAIAVILLRLTLVGSAPSPDEGTAAHLWQLLMGGQLPVILYFSVRWIPASPAPAIRVLALQICAMAAAAFPVFYFKW